VETVRAHKLPLSIAEVGVKVGTVQLHSRIHPRGDPGKPRSHYISLIINLGMSWQARGDSLILFGIRAWYVVLTCCLTSRQVTARQDAMFHST
jgi:hypothetical protein